MWLVAITMIIALTVSELALVAKHANPADPNNKAPEPVPPSKAG